MTNLLKNLIYPVASNNKKRLKEHFSGKWVVITGASHGIGKELTYKLIESKANLYLLARTEAELQKICQDAENAGCHARYYAIDLRDRNELDKLCSKLKDELPQVDYFFANAGKSIHRKITDALDRLHDFDRTMDLNFRSMVALSLALQPALSKQKGCIIYTSAVSSLYPSAPGWSAYHASKAAANTWCETADAEWKSWGRRMKIAYMPLVHTQMSDVNKTYKNMPAYSASEAADLLLRLSLNNRHTYKPWWARMSAPIAYLLSPLIRFTYRNCIKA